SREFDLACRASQRSRHELLDTDVSLLTPDRLDISQAASLLDSVHRLEGSGEPRDVAQDFRSEDVLGIDRDDDYAVIAERLPDLVEEMQGLVFLSECLWRPVESHAKSDKGSQSGDSNDGCCSQDEPRMVYNKAGGLDHKLK